MRDKYSNPYDASGRFDRTVKERHDEMRRSERKTTASDSSLPNACCYRFSCKCLRRVKGD